MAQKYIEHYPVSDELREAVGQVAVHVLDCLDRGPRTSSTREDRLGGQAAHDRIVRRLEKRGASWNDPRVFMLDLQYHDIRLGRGLYYLLERKGAGRRGS